MICQDQLNRQLVLPGHPQRIVSLVPSQTELLHYLGLEEEVVGITKFCIHPEHWFRNKTRVGGTKTVKTDLVVSLRPELVIANKEENTKEQIDILEKTIPVWISDVGNTADAFGMIHGIGEITGKAQEAAALVNRLTKDFTALQLLIKEALTRRYRTAYLIWKDPYMAAGGDTFISSILAMAGMSNVFQHSNRYPQTHLSELIEKETELVLLSSEPYPFKQPHMDELQQALPAAKILLVDGEIFSWYGSRMLHILPYLRSFLPRLAE